MTDPEDFDVFTALVAGLADQQVSNDPGGDRWVRHSARVVDMFFADIDRLRRAAQKATKRNGTKSDGRGKS